MSEIIGTFSLEHVSNTYTVEEGNLITNHTNWKGTAEGYGSVFGTLTFAPVPLGEMNDTLEGGEVRWTGQGFLEDGTNVAGTGVGTWEKVPEEHIWKTDYILEISDGTKIRSVGEIALETMMFTGQNYAVE
jgi:hypothetical protein